MRTTRYRYRWIANAIIPLVFSMSAYGQTELIEVSDPRPLQAAVLQLNQKYSTPITYEDPRYLFPDELRDVTSKETPSGFLKRIIPAGGDLRVSYSAVPTTAQPADLVAAVQGIVDAQNAASMGGRFVVLRTEKAIHVIPIETRDRNGNWVRDTPVLDTLITLSTREGTGQELLDAIVDAVSKASGEKFWGAGGTQVTNALHRYHGKVSATQEPARDVLMRVLGEIGPRYTYLLDYDPSAPAYSLGIGLSAEDEAKPQPPVPRRHDPTQPGPAERRSK